MTVRTKLIFVIALIFGLAAITAIYKLPSADESTAKKVGQQSSDRSASSSAVSIETSIALDQNPARSDDLIANIAASNISAKIRAEFAGANDYRAFSELAKQRISEGGPLYAKAAIDYCIEATQILKTSGILNGVRPVDVEIDSQVYAKRLKAGQTLNDRCAGFLSSELQVDALDGVRDPLQKIMESTKIALQNKNQQQVKIAIDSAFASEDPLVLNYVLRKVLLAHIADNPAGVIYLNGIAYKGGDAHLVIDAAYVATCYFGRPCDETEIKVAAACLSARPCFGNLVDLTKYDVEGKSERGRKLDEFLQTIVSGIRAGRPEVFMKPS